MKMRLSLFWSKWKRVFFVVVLLSLSVVGIAGYFWKYRHNETLRFLMNSPLTTLVTRGAQADPKLVWELSQNHVNPQPIVENFDGSAPSSLWPVVNLNGNATVTHPPEVHAANIEIVNGEAVLSVLHDPNFENESTEKTPGTPSRPRYNNAYMTGMAGFSPTPKESVVIEAKFIVDPDFGGSTGIWMEEKGTFNPETGIMEKPFRTFGLSFVGPESNTFLRGLNLEAVVGNAVAGIYPTCAKFIPNVNVAQDNVYKLVWSLSGERNMKVDVYVNETYYESCVFPSFFLGEIQIWADNYDIEDITADFFNVPFGRVDSTHYDYKKIYTIPTGKGG